VAQLGGSAEGWETMLVGLIRSHARTFFLLAHRIVKDTQAAEDVCQQAFLRAWERRDGIRDPLALRGWLAKVIVNEGLQICRRRKTEARTRDLHVPEQHGGMSAHERTELRDPLYAALGELPEQTQAVVVLRLVQGMSGNEVKALLNCSASEVSRRLHQGMEHLRSRLAAAYARD